MLANRYWWYYKGCRVIGKVPPGVRGKAKSSQVRHREGEIARLMWLPEDALFGEIDGSVWLRAKERSRWL